MGFFGATLIQVFTCARRADVSLRDVTIAQMGKRGYRVRVTSRTGSARRILEIWKKSVSWVEYSRPKKKGVFRLLAEALGRCRTRCGGGRWKSQNKKIVHRSPYVEEPLNSKVIKSFVPELRSRKCFSYFEIPMFYVYIWTLYVHFAYPYLAMVQRHVSQNATETPPQEYKFNQIKPNHPFSSFCLL